MSENLKNTTLAILLALIDCFFAWMMTMFGTMSFLEALLFLFIVGTNKRFLELKKEAKMEIKP